MKSQLNVMQMAMVACVFLLAVAPARTQAQCVNNNSHETSLLMVNASNFLVTLNVDGVNRGSVPAGQSAFEIFLPAGEHFVSADATLNGERLSAARMLLLPAGSICTWTVTNPGTSPRSTGGFQDSLFRQAIMSLVVAN